MLNNATIAGKMFLLLCILHYCWQIGRNVLTRKDCFARVDKRSKISNIAVMCGDFHRPPTTTTTTTINKTMVSIQLSSKCFPLVVNNECFYNHSFKVEVEVKYFENT